MNEKEKRILIGVLVFLALFLFLLLFFDHPYPYEDENTLFVTEFPNKVLRFERLDYALGQNQVVGVQRSNNKGKTFETITEEPILLSLEPKLLFLTENLGFAIAKTNLSKENHTYQGFKVTQDGGVTFQDSKIDYENSEIEILTVETLPYYEKDALKFDALIYVSKEDDSGYEEKKLTFVSEDNGLSWKLEESSR